MRFEFDGSEGRVSVRVWEHPGARRLVVIAHGYGEHIERYDHVASALHARGAAVYGPDHLGHGRSAGERVLIANLEHWWTTWCGSSSARKPRTPDGRWCCSGTRWAA